MRFETYIALTYNERIQYAYQKSKAEPFFFLRVLVAGLLGSPVSLLVPIYAFFLWKALASS